MKLETKQNGAKENSRWEEKKKKKGLSCRRFQRLPGVVPLSTRSYFPAE